MATNRTKACIAALAGSVLVLAGLARRRGFHLVRGAMPPACVYLTRDGAGEAVRVLRSGGVYQSATYVGARRFEPVFPYIASFDLAFDLADQAAPGRSCRRMLMLGGGAFSWPKHVLTTYGDLALDVVEYSPAMVEAARRWFYLDELERLLVDPATARGNRLGIAVGDGRAYLDAHGTAPRYDAVVNDAFSGAEPAARLASVEAARAVKRCLVPGGSYLMNVVSRAGGSDLTFLRDEVATLMRVFSHVWVVPAADEDLGGEDNYLVVASDVKLRVPDAVPFGEDFPGTVMRDAERFGSASDRDLG